MHFMVSLGLLFSLNIYRKVLPMLEQMSLISPSFSDFSRSNTYLNSHEKSHMYKLIQIQTSTHTAKPLKIWTKINTFSAKANIFKHTLLWLFINVNILFQKFKHSFQNEHWLMNMDTKHFLLSTFKLHWNDL